MEIKALELKANKIRQHIISMLEKAGSGHSGGALGMADVMTVLYFDVIKIDPKKPHLLSRDFFILSNGHTCPVLYATLAEKGFFSTKKLQALRKLGSDMQGHPHNLSLPGVENSGGALGQGFSQAVGLAAALKRDNKRNRVFCYVGDGELEEGQCWEAAMFASKENLDNLVLIIDRNNIQIDGNTQEVLHPGPFDSKFKAFGWQVLEFDAHNIKEIRAAFRYLPKLKNKPICFIARATPGKGVSFMEGDYKWHGRAPNSEQAKKALNELKNEERKLQKNGK